MFSLQPSQVQQQIHVPPEMMSTMANGQQAMMTQHTMQTMTQHGMAVQQMMPGTQMIMAPGIGGYMQYPQGIQGIHPAALGMTGQLGQVGVNQMGMGQPFIIQPMAIAGRPTAKPVGRVPGRSSGIFGTTQSTGLMTDQSGAGKVKKKKPSPSARRRSRLRLIAFLEAKRKKAEEEGLEPVPELPEDALRNMTDEQLAAHLAGTNPDQDGSVCQSEESNPTNSSSTNPVNSNPTICLPDGSDEIEQKPDTDDLTPSDIPADR